MGENGQLQATFENYGIEYTGNKYTGCLLAMDRDLTKWILVSENIPTAEWVLIDTKADKINTLEVPFPCFVKPCSGGSSVGIAIARNEDELKTATKLAKKYDRYVIAEKRINGREFSVGILDNRMLPVIEIIHSNQFYDYKVNIKTDLQRKFARRELMPI